VNIDDIEIGFVRVDGVETWRLDATVEFSTGEPAARFSFTQGDEELDAQVSALVGAVKSHARRRFAEWGREA
jgi:hypothetical protein